MPSILVIELVGLISLLFGLFSSPYSDNIWFYMSSWIYDDYDEHDIYEHSKFPIIKIIYLKRLNHQKLIELQ